MNERVSDFIIIVVLFAIIIVGTIMYSNKVEEIKDKKITIISDTEIDK